MFHFIQQVILILRITVFKQPNLQEKRNVPVNVPNASAIPENRVSGTIK